MNKNYYLTIGENNINFRVIEPDWKLNVEVGLKENKD